MSYYCQINFKQISGDKVYSFLQGFKKEVMEHLKEIAEDNFAFSPIFKAQPLLAEEFKVTKKLLDETRSWAINSVFRYRFFYDEKLQLLGVYSVHKPIQNLFDCTVDFQNSCDQDYEFETWKGVRYFEEVAEKWKNVSDEQMKETFKEKREEEWDPKFCSNLDYYRRSFAYEEIWKNFEDTLYDDDSVVHLSLFGFYDFQPPRSFSHFVKEKVKEWVEENKKEIEEMRKRKEQKKENE